VELTQEEKNKRIDWIAEKIRRKMERKTKLGSYSLCCFCKKGEGTFRVMKEGKKKVKDENGSNVIYHQACLMEFLERAKKLEESQEDSLAKDLWMKCPSIKKLIENKQI